MNKYNLVNKSEYHLLLRFCSSSSWCFGFVCLLYFLIILTYFWMRPGEYVNLSSVHGVLNINILKLYVSFIVQFYECKYKYSLL